MRIAAPGLDLVLLAAGFVVWSSAFVVLYGVQALGCEAGWHELPFGPTSVLRAVLVLLWVAHLGLLAGLVAFTARRRAGHTAPDGVFLARAALWTTLAAAVATLWTGAPTLALTLCG